jgi:hypothetical protein
MINIMLPSKWHSGVAQCSECVPMKGTCLLWQCYVHSLLHIENCNCLCTALYCMILVYGEWSINLQTYTAVSISVSNLQAYVAVYTSVNNLQTYTAVSTSVNNLQTYVAVSTFVSCHRNTSKEKILTWGDEHWGVEDGRCTFRALRTFWGVSNGAHHLDRCSTWSLDWAIESLLFLRVLNICVSVSCTAFVSLLLCVYWLLTTN